MPHKMGEMTQNYVLRSVISRWNATTNLMFPCSSRTAEVVQSIIKIFPSLQTSSTSWRLIRIFQEEYQTTSLNYCIFNRSAPRREALP